MCLFPIGSKNPASASGGQVGVLQHLLIEKGLWSYDDLKLARAFIKIQESSCTVSCRGLLS